jgi:hypothetical protein
VYISGLMRVGTIGGALFLSEKLQLKYCQQHAFDDITAFLLS